MRENIKGERGVYKTILFNAAEELFRKKVRKEKDEVGRNILNRDVKKWQMQLISRSKIYINTGAKHEGKNIM